MIVDIRNDLPDLLKYVQRRVKKQIKLSKTSPPVSRINFDFEFGQSNCVFLTFDTREDPGIDRDMAGFSEDIMLKRRKWPVWHKLPEDEQVFFIDIKGKKKNVMKDPDKLVCPNHRRGHETCPARGSRQRRL
jgi:hypothetical protein